MSEPVQPAALGIAGLDQNLRLNVVQGLVETRGYNRSAFGIAGANCHSLAHTVSELLPTAARCGINVRRTSSGVGEIPHRLRTDPTALFGIAGNLNPQARNAVQT